MMNIKQKPQTEMRNPYTTNIDRMTTAEMAACIQRENENAAYAVGRTLPSIEKACDCIAARLAEGGRLIYIGAGSSGRLGVLDAVECPPTYGVPPEMVIGIIAGGPKCMFRAAEKEEDNADCGVHDLQEQNLTEKDTVVGISAAGNAAYVVGALEYANSIGCATVGITSNPGSKITECAQYPIVAETGPEVITGSTRMKAGTAQKMILNMLSTISMIKLGHVYENMMVNLKPTNEKLTRRVISIVEEITGLEFSDAKKLLEANDWNIRKSAEAYRMTNHFEKGE
jgi:N-acetylmuramic acid 6-phosphate etherase